MSPVKKIRDQKARQTHLNEADLETILNYYRSLNSDANPLKIKDIQTYLQAAKSHEKAEKRTFSGHNAAKLATALSGSAVVGLTTAITLPSAPVLVVMSAVVGLIASWAAASKADEAPSEAEKNLEHHR